MVRILGGGFSGLTLAEALVERGIPFELFEAQGHLGGMLRTEKLREGISESAANGILWSPELESLCERLNLKMIEVKKTSKARWIYRQGKPYRWPLGLMSSLRLVFQLIRYKLSSDYFRPESGSLLKDYAISKFGREFTQFLLKPALQGIYGPTFDRLSATLILGKFFDPNRRKLRPRTVSFKGGMQDLVSALTNKIQSKGKVHLNRRVELKDFNPSVGPVVICTDLSTASRLIQGPKWSLAGLVSVTLFSQPSKKSLKGFGCLFSDDQDSEGALGVLFNSEIFESRSRQGERSETWIYDFESVQSLKDLELIQKTMDLRKKLLNESGEIKEHKIWRWPEALPVYSIDLENWLRHIGPFGEFALAGTSIRIHGNYGGEIGLSSILQRSQILADKIGRMT